jgi:hypothetical protein
MVAMHIGRIMTVDAELRTAKSPVTAALGHAGSGRNHGARGPGAVRLQAL